MRILNNIIIMSVKLKKRFPAIHQVNQTLNDILVCLFYNNRINRILNKERIDLDSHTYMLVFNENHLKELEKLVTTQTEDHLTYFSPHNFDRHSLKRVLSSKSHLTFGMYRGKKLVGYGLLKLYLPRKAFIGRLIDQRYSGQGLGKKLSSFLYDKIRELNFDGYSTISDQNIASLRSHQRLGKITFVRTIDGEYSLYKYDLK